MENKPFVFGVATSGDNFTDRKKETARLLSNFRHGVNTVLISPRRWGKTSLVRKVCRLAQSDTLKVVYLDIFLVVANGNFTMLSRRLCSNRLLPNWRSGWKMPGCSFRGSALRFRWARSL